jgi:hypothetical protein
MQHVDSGHHLEQFASQLERRTIDARHIDFSRLAFAYTMNSGTVLAGTDGCTSMTFGTRTMLAIGAMSRRKTKFSLS